MPQNDKIAKMKRDILEKKQNQKRLALDEK